MNQTLKNRPVAESIVWRMAGGNAARTGRFPTKDSRSIKLEQTWRAGGSVKAPVVFSGEGVAFVADMSGGVAAFDADGGILWRKQFPGGISAAPALCGSKERLFVGTLRGSVCALSVGDGRELWRYEVRTESDPRILSDLLHVDAMDSVLLSSWGGRFVGLSTKTGEECGAWNAGVYPRSAAAADRDGNVFLVRAVWDQGVELVQVSPAGEESVLHREPPSPRGAKRTVVAAAPVLDGERSQVCFITNRDREAVLQAWSWKSGGIAWRRALPAAVAATPSVDGRGRSIVADLAGTVRCVDGDGTPVWEYATGCEYLLAGAVIDGAGSTWIGDPWGRLHQIESDGRGKVVDEAERSIETQPSFAPDGRLVVPGTSGEVRVFG
jgi:outer membrane protein assembly factor BamB